MTEQIKHTLSNLENLEDYEKNEMTKFATNLARNFLNNTEDGEKLQEEYFLKFKIAEAKVDAFTTAINHISGLLPYE